MRKEKGKDLGGKYHTIPADDIQDMKVPIKTKSLSQVTYKSQPGSQHGGEVVLSSALTSGFWNRYLEAKLTHRREI